MALSALIRLMRPRQWVKNLFVFAGLLFSHAWGDTGLVMRVVAAALAFSFMASAIYVINDLADREADRRHPVKRHRPLASGAVGVPAALVLALLLTGAAAAIAAWVSATVLRLIAAYALINLAYSAGLKQVVILDVFLIAAGFMLRILAGTVGVDIAPSQWLLLTGLFLTLFLGFAKRRAEWSAAAGAAAVQRKVLAHYGPELLDHMLSVAAAGVVMSYSLYTVSADTVARHGTTNLIYTVPFVLYGIFRYIYMMHHESRGEDPASDLLFDAHILFTFACWLGVTLWLIA
ncbi:decaprenyl-phosphate phosphoribosyltransferase [Thiobacter aerophilum]|uniref:Decaprenyl-phosphate phosphoribosyltransferase n=1 Tax=Thiobacter aerophilum TaxID=3121275 RepID=A0ABV0EF92_9BURK